MLETGTLTNFVVATDEFRGNGAPERTEYHNLVALDRLADCGQFPLTLRSGPCHAPDIRGVTGYLGAREQRG